MDKPLRCLIVDDDPIILDMLSHFIDKVDFFGEAVTADNGADAINLLSSNSFDVLFLDYDLPEMTGEEILQCIGSNLSVVMITSNAQFAPASYDYSVVDFIVKPVEFSRFFKAAQKVQKQHEIQSKAPRASVDKSQSLFIKDGNNLVRINLKELLYLKSESNYVNFRTRSSKHLGLANLKDLISELPDNFVRIHRSYIVNLNAIDRIEHSDVVVNEEYLPMSATYKEDLLKKLKLLT